MVEAALCCGVHQGQGGCSEFMGKCMELNVGQSWEIKQLEAVKETTRNFQPIYNGMGQIKIYARVRTDQSKFRPKSK